jgi:hypothetical protein
MLNELDDRDSRAAASEKVAAHISEPMYQLGWPNPMATLPLRQIMIEPPVRRLPLRPSIAPAT